VADPSEIGGPSRLLCAPALLRGFPCFPVLPAFFKCLFFFSVTPFVSGIMSIILANLDRCLLLGGFGPSHEGAVATSPLWPRPPLRPGLGDGTADQRPVATTLYLLLTLIWKNRPLPSPCFPIILLRAILAWDSGFVGVFITWGSKPPFTMISFFVHRDPFAKKSPSCWMHNTIWGIVSFSFFSRSWRNGSGDSHLYPPRPVALRAELRNA